MQPLDGGFIDLPQKFLDHHRKQGEASTLGRVIKLAAHMQSKSIGSSSPASAVLYGRGRSSSLRSAYHNDLPPKHRAGIPRIYFEGNNVDNDSISELFEMLSISCVDPDVREERWGVTVISKSGGTLETAAAYRAIRREMAEFYGPHSEQMKNLVVPITGETGKLRALCKADGIPDDAILPIPDDVGGRYSVFTAVACCPPQS